MTPPPNKRMKLTKRGAFVLVGAPPRASVIESRFAAYPRCYPDGSETDR
jgi:hypothetical protein